MPILKKTYVKASQLILHNAPAIFKEKEPLAPQFQMQINHTKLGEKQYEVNLTVKIAAKRGQLEAYELLITQAGEFEIEIKEANKQLLLYALEAECPSVLLPLVRQQVVFLTQASGFAPFLVPELDFKGIHTQRMAEITRREALTAVAQRETAATRGSGAAAAGVGAMAAAAHDPEEQYSTPPSGGAAAGSDTDTKYAELRL